MAQFGKRGPDDSRLPNQRTAAGAPIPRVTRHTAGASIAASMTAQPAFDSGIATSPAAAEYDAGLRAYMLGVYNLMLLGVAFSGAITLALIMMPDTLEAMMNNPLFGIGIFCGTLGLSWFSPTIIKSESPLLGHLFYWTYCALWGAGLAPMISFLIEEDASSIITVSFFLAASLFGAASIYGYTTRRSLTGLGCYLCMLTVGLLIAAILNLLVFEFNGFSFVCCVATVVIFTAVTAWETQIIKDLYSAKSSSAQRESRSIFGAFQLYGSFMMIFSRLMRIFWQLLR